MAAAATQAAAVQTITAAAAAALLTILSRAANLIRATATTKAIVEGAAGAFAFEKFSNLFKSN